MKKLSSLLAAVSFLAACGGNDNDPPSPTVQAPAPAPAPNPLAAIPGGAVQSSQGLVSYLLSLTTASGADAASPLSLAAVTLPQPDNTEPEPLP